MVHRPLSCISARQSFPPGQYLQMGLELQLLMLAASMRSLPCVNLRRGGHCHGHMGMPFPHGLHKLWEPGVWCSTIGTSPRVMPGRGLQSTFSSLTAKAVQ